MSFWKGRKGRKGRKVTCGRLTINPCSRSSKNNKAIYFTLYPKSPRKTPTRRVHPQTPTSPTTVVLTPSTVYCEVDCSPININALNNVMEALWKGSPPSFPDL